MSESPDLPAVSQPASPEGDDDGIEEEGDEVDVDEDEEEDEQEEEATLAGRREISPLASWTVSTYKPGCGVAALLNPSTAQFWQSDGPQPHLLNIHFFKLVTITRLRVYLDLELDESYTPTRMLFFAGHSEYDVVEFYEWRAPANNNEGPRGWQDISLENCWSPEMTAAAAAVADDDSQDSRRAEPALRCMFLQVRVLENHQNGKDTHIRGVQIWARDERDGRAAKRKPLDYVIEKREDQRQGGAARENLELYPEADFGEGEIR